MEPLLLITVLGWLSSIGAGVLAIRRQWRWSPRATLLAAASGVLAIVTGLVVLVDAFAAVANADSSSKATPPFIDCPILIQCLGRDDDRAAHRLRSDSRTSSAGKPCPAMAWFHDLERAASRA